MKEYGKRYYHSFTQFYKDIKELNKIKKINKANGYKNKIDNDFREKIMLAVTGVNDCRYCSYIHSKLALKSGVLNQELDSLLNGEFKNCPEEEIPAILYAQHWAESNGNPDDGVKQRLEDLYGKEKTSVIEMYLRIIRLGNLTGNTIDYFLFKLSNGKFGLKK